MPRHNVVTPGLDRPANNQNAVRRDEEVANNQVVMPRPQESTEQTAQRAERGFADIGGEGDQQNQASQKMNCIAVVKMLATAMCSSSHPPSAPRPSISTDPPAAVHEPSETGSLSTAAVDTQPQPASSQDH